MRVFLRKFFTVASGGLLGQVAVVLAAPVLSRIFDPQDYGIYGLVLSVSMILIFVSTLRYEEVIISGKTETSRACGFVLSCLILFSIFLLMEVAILLLVATCDGWAGGCGFRPEIYLFAPVILILGVFQSRIVPPVLIQDGRYRLASIGNFANGSFGAAAQIGFGLLGTGALGLLIGRTLGLAVASVLIVVPVWRRVLVPLLRKVSRRQLLRVARSYRGQALFLAPAGFINTVAMQLPVFVLAASFGAAASGSFFFIQSLASAALMIYRRSITALTAKEAQTLRQRRRPVTPFVLRLLAIVTVVSVSAALACFLYAERILPVIFGSKWEQAGMIARWMGIFYAASAIHAPMSALSTLLKFQRNMFVTQCAQLVATSAALAIGVATGDLETTVALVALATTLVYGANLASMIRVIRRDDTQRAESAVPA